MTKAELFHVTEALEGAKAELEELEHSEEWFSSSALEQIYVAIRILENENIMER